MHLCIVQTNSVASDAYFVVVQRWNRQFVLNCSPFFWWIRVFFLVDKSFL